MLKRVRENFPNDVLVAYRYFPLESHPRAIPAAIEAIALGGRVVVMSYHSLEDKIVKGFFQAGSKSFSVRGTGETRPWYSRTRSHHAWL